MRVTELAKQFAVLSDIKFQEEKEAKIYLPDSYIKRIIDCFNYWTDHSQTDLAKKELNDFLANPSSQNGTVYEILAYQWFHKNCIHVEYQPEISKEDSLKSKGAYQADGKIDDEIVFDIKTFSFGQPQYVKLQNDFNDMWKEERTRLIEEQKVKVDNDDSTEDIPDYYIMISGNSDLSTQMMSKLLEKKQDIYKALFSECNKNFTDYIYHLQDYGLIIRAHFYKSGEVKSFTGISEFNVDRWAMLNETQVLSHCSQYCRNKPYFLIYPYDREKIRHMYFDDQNLFYAFRTLMRRSFLHLQHNERYINGYDGKADKDMRVCEVIHKLSAVFFLDVTEEYEYGKTNAFLFINPNADNPLKEIQVEHYFRQNGVTICDFYYDNY